MLLELVLVAAVLALAGLAVYQANHRDNGVATVETKPATSNSTEGLAQSASSIAETDATTDSATSAGADAMADELSATSDDVTTLGDTSNATF
jgi:hypothetical protein